MSTIRIVGLTVITMVAFASNSLLCRLALKEPLIDAASFTSIRLVAGAVVLWLIASFFRKEKQGGGSWLAAGALFAYAACFSFAYIQLSAGTGALLLFGAVQITMIGHSWLMGERLKPLQIVGVFCALAGLVGIVLPSIKSPSTIGAILMFTAGAAWGVYSLLGKSAGDPIQATAGNFLRSVVFAVFLSGACLSMTKMNTAGVCYAIASGAITSGVGYAIWYTVLPAMNSTTAATVQLSVPVIAAVGGILFLEESLTLQLVVASVAILGGIGLVISSRKTPQQPKESTTKQD